MRLGLIGWGVASGNGGMNTDIACLASYVTKWLIPTHPKLPLHSPYIEKAKNSVHLSFVNPGDNYDECIDTFCKNIDGVIYIEHPIFNLAEYDYNVVDRIHLNGKKVYAIPMWEWWPEEEHWALETDCIWSVTSYTGRYFRSLVDVLESRGVQPKWKKYIFGDRWGVNLDDFEYRQRNIAQHIVFVRGNAGYKDRKAGKLIIPALIELARDSEYKITCHSQADMSHYTNGQNPNFIINNKTYLDRKSVYSDGDIFIFCSHWEGLCHGIYEASYSGGIVLTTNEEPMNECIPALFVSSESITSEKLAKPIKKAIPSMQHMLSILNDLEGVDISDISKNSHQWIKENRNLKETISLMYSDFVKVLDT